MASTPDKDDYHIENLAQKIRLTADLSDSEPNSNRASVDVPSVLEIAVTRSLTNSLEKEDEL